MPRQPIDTSDTGDTISEGFTKTDQNFMELYTGLENIDTTVAWDEVQNKPQTFPSTWDEVSGKPTIYPSNWQSVADKPESYPPQSHEHEHFSRIDNPHNTTREQVAAAPVYSQTINMLADSGRFGGKQNPLSLYTPDTFVPSSFFGSFNGSTVSAGGKFIHNNTTNGGTRGALAEDVTSLLAAMNRTNNNARYGVEFHILQITAGSGTAVPQTAEGYTGYLICSNGATAVFGFGNYATLTLWVRIKTGEALIVPYRGHLRRNEIPVDRSFALTPQSGWTHVNTQTTSLSGYDSPFPNLSAKEGAVVQIACPAVFAGQAFPGMHVAPLPTFNEQVTV